jgi:tetratricopeptide (TPR) repeat protein
MLLGGAYYFLGDLARAIHLLEKARRLDEADPGGIEFLTGGAVPTVPICGYGARCQHLAGNTAAALALIGHLWAVATLYDHVPTKAWAIQMRAWAALLTREPELAIGYADDLWKLSEISGLRTRLAQAKFALGRAQIQLGDLRPGVQIAREGLQLLREVGGLFHCSEYGAQIASDLVTANQADWALDFIEFGELIQLECEERHYGPELMRLRGCWLESQGNKTGARAAVQSALEAARQMGAGMSVISALLDLERMGVARGDG